MSPLINKVGNFITMMTRPDAKAPIVALEATVTGGRTVQAKKRGGEDEARERLIEESTGAIVWLWGVKAVNNYIGDPILKKLFGAEFDVGTDKVLRTPFKNLMNDKPPKGFSQKSVALIKATKVLASVIIADAFIGLVVPPLNQKLTRKLVSKKREEANAQAESQNNDKLELSTKKQASAPTFKGNAISAINSFTNVIENTNAGQLLSCDVGLTGGRIYSARNNNERREIAIRDITSIYFYMWAQGHIGNILNFAQTGRFTRLNPNTAAMLDKNLVDFMKKQGKDLTVEEFRKLVLGKNPADIKLPDNIKFETAELSNFDKFMNKLRKNPKEALQVALVDDLLEIKEFQKENILSRIKEMADLQPAREGKKVVTKQQIIDAINVSEINNPELLSDVFKKYSNGASTDQYRFFSNDKLYKLKAEMIDYIEDICKDAKDGKISLKNIAKAKNKNIIFATINFIAGFAFASVFLSTLIPKFQYWVTKMKTGKDEFPGLEDLK